MVINHKSEFITVTEQSTKWWWSLSGRSRSTSINI